MKKQKNNLDEAINAFKNEPVPANPPQETVDTTLAKLTKAEPGTIKSRITITERIKTMKSFTKLAAAAVIIIACVLSVTFLDKSVAPAYAIEQTIEANHGIRYLHMKAFRAGHDEPKEYWLECDEFGQIKNARWYMPEWDAPEDGAKAVVWKENKIQIWFKGTEIRESCLATYSKDDAPLWLLDFAKKSNPKLTIEGLLDQQAQGKLTMEIDEPQDKTRPIIVEVTYLPESPGFLPESPGFGRRETLFVDQATKLVTTIELYRLKNGKYEYQATQEFYDHNVPIYTELFDLEAQVPPDVKRYDRELERARLERRLSPDEREKYESMTPKEMAEVFFQACANEDWNEVLKFMTSSEVSQGFKDYYGGLEIINIGEPFKSDRYHGWYVPYEIRLRSGDVKKWNLAVTNQYEVPRYLFDGGL